MNASLATVIYLLLNFIVILYLVVVGCYMLMRKDDTLATHGELVTKQRLMRTGGVAMLVLAALWFLYLPPMLYGCVTGSYIYDLIFLITLMCYTPMVFHVMFAVVQRRVHALCWTCALGAPFLLLTVWLMCMPDSMLPIYLGSALSVASYLLLILTFRGEYRRYIRRIRLEYSDTSYLDIVWSWVCFSGLALQGIVYVVYEFVWSPLLELLYMLFTCVNAAALCYYACRQRTIDLDVVPEVEPDVVVADQPEEKAFYADIENRLKTMCEEKLLFLDPDITRETLCQRLAINRTYLSMYFHSRGLTFYQYINTLRVEYAYRMMQENPHLSLRKISEQSGFRSVTTFRKVFQEVKGCLPSEVKTNKQNNDK